MKFSSSLTLATSALALLFVSPAAAWWRGFNLGSNRNDGSCKATADYVADINAIKSWPNNFNAIRLFASSDCNTLQQAVPAAQQTGFKILVGVWTEDATHYSNEKNALLAAIKLHGTSWIAAVSVGSEDLYRGDTTAEALAGQIYDVRGMVHQYDKNIEVGHTDTWTAWVNPANNAVILACDVVISDAYPYWQGSSIAGAPALFFTNYNQVQAMVKSVRPTNTPLVWIGETGWPTGGATLAAAVPGSTAAKAHWRNIGCKLMKTTHMFYYAAFDAPTASAGVEQHFGVAYSGRTRKFDLTCPK